MGHPLFTVLRPARYVDEQERVDFGELHVFTGHNYVVTIRHAESPDLASVRRRLEGNRELLCLGPEAVLYAIFDRWSMSTARSWPGCTFRRDPFRLRGNLRRRQMCSCTSPRHLDISGRRVTLFFTA